ncbi:MAG: class I SAM-dependent methyltransferase [Spirochaetota bacterium]
MGEYSIAPVYDLLLYPFVHKLRQKLLAICVEKDYDSILDVCCGTGRQLKMLRRHGFNVRGVDLSEEMLRVSQKGPYAPDCLNEDAARMSFEADSFHAAMTTFALHEKPAETARAILKEMIRVVRPGGHLILTDFHFTEQSSRFSKAVIKAIEWTAGGEHYRNFKEFIRIGGLTSLVDDLPVDLLEKKAAGLNSLAILIYRV